MLCNSTEDTIVVKEYGPVTLAAKLLCGKQVVSKSVDYTSTKVGTERCVGHLGSSAIKNLCYKRRATIAEMFIAQDEGMPSRWKL